MSEAAAENAAFGQSKLARQFADFALVGIDQLATGFTMHAGETVTQRPYPPAESLPRLKNRHRAAPALERTRSRKPSKSCAHDNNGCSCHTPISSSCYSRSGRCRACKINIAL